MMNNNAQKCLSIRWILHNDIVFIAILLPVVSDKDTMLKYILTYLSL